MNDNNHESMMGKVTTEMLYEFLRDFKADVNRGQDELRNLIKHETVQREKLEERTDRRLEKIEAKLDEIYESRKLMTVRFTTGWAFGSLFMAFLSTTMALVFTRVF